MKKCRMISTIAVLTVMAATTSCGNVGGSVTDADEVTVSTTVTQKAIGDSTIAETTTSISDSSDDTSSEADSSSRAESTTTSAKTELSSNSSSTNSSKSSSNASKNSSSKDTSSSKVTTTATTSAKETSTTKPTATQNGNSHNAVVQNNVTENNAQTGQTQSNTEQGSGSSEKPAPVQTTPVTERTETTPAPVVTEPAVEEQPAENYRQPIDDFSPVKQSIIRLIRDEYTKDDLDVVCDHLNNLVLSEVPNSQVDYGLYPFRDADKNPTFDYSQAVWWGNAGYGFGYDLNVLTTSRYLRTPMLNAFGVDPEITEYNISEKADEIICQLEENTRYDIDEYYDELSSDHFLVAVYDTTNVDGMNNVYNMTGVWTQNWKMILMYGDSSIPHDNTDPLPAH